MSEPENSNSSNPNQKTVTDRITVSDNFFVQGQLEITRSMYSGQTPPMSKGAIPAGFCFDHNWHVEASAIVMASMEGAYKAALNKAFNILMQYLQENSFDGAFNLDIQQQVEPGGINSRMDVFLYCDICKKVI
jgi:hypothetical protein